MLVIQEITERTDRNGNEYRSIKFHDETNPYKVVSRTFWRGGSDEVAFDYSEGDIVDGVITTEYVVPYTIGTSKRKYNTYTTVVLGKYPTQDALQIEINRVYSALKVPLKDKQLAGSPLQQFC